LFDREENRDAFAANPERYLHDARERWPGLLATLAE
jgi:YHS domain-containing protein